MYPIKDSYKHIGIELYYVIGLNYIIHITMHVYCTIYINLFICSLENVYFTHRLVNKYFYIKGICFLPIFYSFLSFH